MKRKYEIGIGVGALVALLGAGGIANRMNPPDPSQVVVDCDSGHEVDMERSAVPLDCNIRPSQQLNLVYGSDAWNADGSPAAWAVADCYHIGGKLIVRREDFRLACDDVDR